MYITQYFPHLMAIPCICKRKPMLVDILVASGQQSKSRISYTMELTIHFHSSVGYTQLILLQKLDSLYNEKYTYYISSYLCSWNPTFATDVKPFKRVNVEISTK